MGMLLGESAARLGEEDLDDVVELESGEEGIYASSSMLVEVVEISGGRGG